MRYLIFILLCCSAFSQNVTNLYVGQQLYVGQALTTVPSAAAASETQTNLTGYSSLAWYVVNSSTFTTNGSWAVLTDSFTNHYNLSNNLLGAYSPKKLPSNINGNDVLSFNSTATGTALWNDTSTSSIPFEVVLVVNFTNVTFATANYVFSGGHNATPRYSSIFWTGTFLISELTSGNTLPGTVAGTLPPTNVWTCVDIIFNGANSAIYTNNVLYVSGNIGNTNGANGFTLGSFVAYQDSYLKGTEMLFGEACLYGKGAVPGTNTTARTKLYNILKAKYSLP